jgi:hypothetical protein
VRWKVIVSSILTSISVPAHSEGQGRSIDEAPPKFGLNEDSQLYSRYRTMEAAALRLQKEAKGYLDSLRGKLADPSITVTSGPEADSDSNDCVSDENCRNDRRLLR